MPSVSLYLFMSIMLFLCGVWFRVSAVSFLCNSNNLNENGGCVSLCLSVCIWQLTWLFFARTFYFIAFFFVFGLPGSALHFSVLFPFHFGWPLGLVPVCGWPCSSFGLVLSCSVHWLLVSVCQEVGRWAQALMAPLSSFMNMYFLSSPSLHWRGESWGHVSPVLCLSCRAAA